MMVLRHPSKKALREWLSGEHGAELDAHLGSCQRCAGVLENMDDIELNGAGSSNLAIGDALAAVFTAPEDLSDRLEKKVAARLDSRAVFDVVTDLFGAGIETSRILLLDDPAD